MRLVLLLILLLAAVPARAHAILVESQPAVQGVVPPGIVAVVFRFNSRIDVARSRLLLVRADHGQTPIEIDPAGAVDRLEAHVTLGSGAYSLRWQVLAVDGHITRGDVPFTVVAPAATASVP